MAIIGAFARVDLSDPQAVRERLSALAGVSLFDLGEPGKVGMVIEGDDLDGAYENLRAAGEDVEGVLGVWPVYAHMEPDLSDTEQQTPC